VTVACFWDRLTVNIFGLLEMKSNLRCISIAILSAVLPLYISAQPAQPKPIIDGTGAFGKALVQRLSTDSDGRQRKNIQPFVIGYCGWRVRGLTLYPITKFEGMQLGLCKTILDVFDPQITPALKGIENRADSVSIPIEATAAESKVIEDFVVVKYGMFYMGLSDPNAKPDPNAKWKYGVGSNLGELAAHLTLWWRIWNEPKFEAKVGSQLAALGELLRNAPKNIDPAFAADMRALSLMGLKTKFTPAERAQINQLLTRALAASVSLGSVANANDSVPPSSARPTRNSGDSSSQSSAEFRFEAGKVLAVKSEFKAALVEFDQAVKLDPQNGLIYFHRALTKEKLGLVDGAINDYTAVILLRTSLREAYFNRGTLYLNKKEYKSAVADLNSAIVLDPKYEAAFYNRGLAYYNLEQIYAALGDFNNVIKLNPKNANGYLMRSYVYCSQGLTSAATRDQEMASQLGASFERGCK